MGNSDVDGVSVCQFDEGRSVDCVLAKGRGRQSRSGTSALGAFHQSLGLPRLVLEPVYEDADSVTNRPFIANGPSVVVFNEVDLGVDKINSSSAPASQSAVIGAFEGTLENTLTGPIQDSVCPTVTGGIIRTCI